MPTTIGTACSRNIRVARPGAALATVARQLVEKNVGAIVVVEPQGAGLKPVGMVTDRDIVCGQIVGDRDLFRMVVDDVMSSDVFTLSETCGIAEAIGLMCVRGVRRGIVIDEAGNMVGIVSIDDLFPLLAKDLGALAQLIRSESAFEAYA